MPSPHPLECSDPTCEFKTPEGCPTWDLMVTLLTQHTQTVHAGGGLPHVVSSQSSKLEKLPRPVFSLHMTEAQWTFTKIQWENYIGQTEVSESTKLSQLQAACKDELRQRIFDTGAYSTLTTPETFLTKMEELAVLKVHKSVHLRNLWRMTQQPDETIRAYVARLTSTADMSNMTVECRCNAKVSYRDNVIQQLVIHGMRDSDIRVRVLSRNTNGELTTLKKLVDYIQAEEAGKNESQDLTVEDYHVGGVRKQSNYQKERKNCMHCGQPRHTKNNTPDDRRRHCKAYSIVCNKCNKRGHYASVCLQKQKPSSTPKADIQQVSGESSPVAEVSNVATFFALSANNSDKIPSNAKDVAVMVQEIRSTQEGPITTIPLPHHVHNKMTGWMEKQPYQSPTILAQFSIDRQSYAELNLPMPKLSPGRNPGRTYPIYF